MKDPTLASLDFVVCPSYHGATLLALLLNNHPALTSLGDTYPTRRFDQKCGCGKQVSVCEFWRDVSREAHADRFADYPDLLPPAPRVARRQSLNRFVNVTCGLAGLIAGPAVWFPFSRQTRLYLDSYAGFRRAVLRYHGTSRIVDGQKDRLKILVLRSLLGRSTTIRVVHLLRDPRGFLNSCRKYGDLTLERVAWLWRTSHSRIARFQRWPLRCNYLAVRYEDLCAEPGRVMGELFSFLGVPDADVCHAADDPGDQHMIGNKMLYRFDGTIRLDGGWRERLPDHDRTRVLELTQPISGRYGYRPD